MPLVNLKLIVYRRKKPKRRKTTPALLGCPQKKGDCILIYKKSPKKPNSAKRSVVKARISSGYRVEIFIPGITHNLQKHSSIIVRGGKTQDLPGLQYKAVRGLQGLNRVVGMRRGRSKYGTKKDEMFNR